MLAKNQPISQQLGDSIYTIYKSSKILKFKMASATIAETVFWLNIAVYVLISITFLCEATELHQWQPLSVQ